MSYVVNVKHLYLIGAGQCTESECSGPVASGGGINYLQEERRGKN
jgi:hypothetical protein